MSAYFTFESIAPKLSQLSCICSTTEEVVEQNRKIRFVEIDSEEARAQGHLLPDDMFIPVRLVDSNITREQAKYVAYILQSSRVAIIKCLDSQIDTQPIEDDFTQKFRYVGWQHPLVRVIDSMQTHGYGVACVEFSVDYPGHFKIVDVPISDFCFFNDVRDIQHADVLMHKIYFDKEQLAALEKNFGFNSTGIKKVIDSFNESETVKPIEKILFKHNGVVYVGWTAHKVFDDWLRPPKPLYQGRKTPDRKEATESEYPYVVFRYSISEDTIISNSKGRAFFDSPAQETVTSLMSSFVSAHRRASNLYFSKDTDSGDFTNQPTDIKLIPGKLFDGKIRQFQLSPPDPTMLVAIQGIVTQNLQENAQINYAAQNRKDSRKTATEISAAVAESALLSSVQVALFSSSFTELLNKCWEIYQGRIKSGNLDSPVKELVMKHKFSIKPAGDTDVIERQQKIVRMQQTWPVVAQTPMAKPFLKRLVELMFPDDAKYFLSFLDKEESTVTLVGAMLPLLKALAFKPDGSPEPEIAENVGEVSKIISLAEQYMKKYVGTK